MSEYSKYKNLNKLVMLTPDEQAQSDNSESLYAAGQAQYEQPSIKKAALKTNDEIDPSKVVLDAKSDEIYPSKVVLDIPKPQLADREYSPQEALNLHKQGVSLANIKLKPNTFKSALQDEINANPFIGKIAAAGSGLSDMIEGTKQLFGKENKTQLEANKIFSENNPAMAIGGDIALYAGTGMLAPITNTVKGAAAVGGLSGFLSPTEGKTSADMVKSKLANAAGGALLAGGITKGIEKAGQSVVNSIAGRQLAKSQNATIDESTKAAFDAGFKIPVSLYNPSFTSNRLEAMGGKIAVKQAATDANQKVANNLARKSLNLPEKTPLDINAIESVRKQAYKPYEQIADISQGAKNTLEDLKQNRSDATAWFNSYNRTANPEHLAKAKEFRDVADTAENVLEDYARQAGRPHLVNDLKDARKMIAKTYTVERALNADNGNIDARVIGRLRQKGKPLSDGLDEIGRFANAFGDVAPKGKAGAGAGISKLDAVLSTALAAGGAGYSGSPEGLALGAIPLVLSPATRKIALSKLLQKTPKYDSKLINLFKAGTTSRYAPMALTGATVPTLAQ